MTDDSLSPSRKRNADDADLSNDASSLSAAKKRAKHTLHQKQPIDDSMAPWFICQDHEATRQQLDRSIALALEAVGFDYGETVALTAFRSLVEEYMSHFLGSVRTSMLAGKRRQTVPYDWAHAVRQHNLTFTALLPHLDPPVQDPTREKHPVLNSKREIMPRMQAEQKEKADTGLQAETDERLLNIILNGREREVRPAGIPASFPSLPPRHTYKASSVMPPRESDPQRVREKAAEEARLGEEALRRFTANAAEIKARTERKLHAEQQKQPSFYAKADEMWKDLMDSFGPPGESGDGRGKGADGTSTMLSGPVNADSRYWRQAPKRIVEKT